MKIKIYLFNLYTLTVYIFRFKLCEAYGKQFLIQEHTNISVKYLAAYMHLRHFFFSICNEQSAELRVP